MEGMEACWSHLGAFTNYPCPDSASSQDRVTMTGLNIAFYYKIDKVGEAAVFNHWAMNNASLSFLTKGKHTKSHVNPSSLPGATSWATAQRSALGNDHHLADLKKQIPEFKVIKVPRNCGASH